jgi:hypothetical protein
MGQKTSPHGRACGRGVRGDRAAGPTFRHRTVTGRTNRPVTVNRGDTVHGMTTRSTLLALTAAALLTLTACESGDADEGKTTPSKKPAAGAEELTDAQREKIREEAGLPPTPKPADWNAYIKALDAIDRDIVHGKEDKAISRGIDSCSSLKRYPDDRAKQVKFTGQRFSSPDHPEGRDTATAEKILTTAQQHICPDF